MAPVVFRVKRSRGVLGEQFMEAEETAEKRPSAFPLAQNTVVDQVSGEEKSSEIKLKKEQDTTKKMDDELESADYGKFLKYFFFVAVIIAVIVLIGSQLLEFQNRD